MSRTWKAILVGTQMAFLLANTSPALAECQEGVLHNLVRAVFQVPAALLDSFRGPTCTDTASGYGPSANSAVRYPAGKGTLGPTYAAGSQRSYEQLPTAPTYVTYKVFLPAKKPTVQKEKETDFHVYGSIPFENQ